MPNKNRSKIENSNWFIFVVFVIYIVVAYKSSGYHHEDEHYQIIEFANYKLGILRIDQLAWEFEAKIRPGFQPFICFCLLKLFNWIGVTDGYNIAFLLRAISAIVSIFVIKTFVNAYKSTIAEKLQSSFVLLSFLLWFLPYINVRFSSESWSGLMFMIVLAFIQKTRYKENLRKYILLGILLGISILFRYQSALLVTGVLLWLILVYKINPKNLIGLIASLGLTISGGILIDFWMYGELTLSIYNYFFVNLVDGVSSNFGVSPFYQYLYYILFRSGPFGIFILVSFVVLLYYQPKNIMLWTVIPFLFVHSIIPHKELRFLYPIANLVPIFLILSYQGVYKRYKLSRWRIIGSVGLVFLVVLNIVGLVAIASTGAGSNKTVVTEWIHRQYGDENLNIIIVNGQNPFIDWGPPKNSYYSSSKLKLDHISSIWQDDFVRHKKDGQVNLLVISYNDFTGSRADRLLRRFHIVEVYRNIPEFLIYLYEIYNPSLNDFGLKVYEFK